MAFVEKREGLFDLGEVYDEFKALPNGLYDVDPLRIPDGDIRSNDQNGYLWGCIYKRLLEALQDAGWEFTLLIQVHEHFKNRFTGEKVINKYTGEVVAFPCSTTIMSKKVFATYCETLREYGREYLGIEIPDPDKWAVENRKRKKRK